MKKIGAGVFFFLFRSDILLFINFFSIIHEEMLFFFLALFLILLIFLLFNLNWDEVAGGT